jgi:hypothetical protein
METTSDQGWLTYVWTNAERGSPPVPSTSAHKDRDGNCYIFTAATHELWQRKPGTAVWVKVPHPTAV